MSRVLVLALVASIEALLVIFWAKNHDYKPPARLNNVSHHYNASKLALLIEPRPLPRLGPLIIHTISTIPSDWKILFIGSSWSAYSVTRASSIRYQQQLGKLDVLRLPKPWRLESQEDVSRLLSDMRFYDDFIPGVEWLLKLDADSVLCANAHRSVEDWLGWSWASLSRPHDGSANSGTGLSLRRISAVRKVLESYERQNNSDPEGVWLSERMSGEKTSLHTHDTRQVMDQEAMGYHVKGGRLAKRLWGRDQRSKVFEYCPEVGIILGDELCSESNKDLSAEKVVTHVGASIATNKAVVGPPQPPPLPRPYKVSI